jgi:hypothetical protein
VEFFLTKRASHISDCIHETLSSYDESIGSTMHNALRYIFGGKSGDNLPPKTFGIFGGKKYVNDELPGSPVCEYFHWKEGSLILILRVIPEKLDVKSVSGFYILELFAGANLTLIPKNCYEIKNYEWKLVHKDKGVQQAWHRFDYYKEQIENQNGISNVVGFIREWTIQTGNIEQMLKKLMW